MRKVRLALAVVILVISLSLLAWGLWPVARERLVLPVEPTEMTLPTPSSFEPIPDNAVQTSGREPAGRSSDELPHYVPAA